MRDGLSAPAILRLSPVHVARQTDRRKHRHALPAPSIRPAKLPSCPGVSGSVETGISVASSSTAPGPSAAVSSSRTVHRATRWTGAPEVRPCVKQQSIHSDFFTWPCRSAFPRGTGGRPFRVNDITRSRGAGDCRFPPPGASWHAVRGAVHHRVSNGACQRAARYRAGSDRCFYRFGRRQETDRLVVAASRKGQRPGRCRQGGGAAAAIRAGTLRSSLCPGVWDTVRIRADAVSAAARLRASCCGAGGGGATGEAFVGGDNTALAGHRRSTKTNPIERPFRGDPRDDSACGNSVGEF